MTSQMRELHKQAERLIRKDMSEIPPSIKRAAGRIGTKPTDARLVADLVRDRIVSRLNSESHKPSVKRVARLIQLHNSALQINETFRIFFKDKEQMRLFLRSPKIATYKSDTKFFYRTGYKFQDDYLEALNRQLNDALDEIYRLTKRYRWFPVFRHVAFGFSQFQGVEYWRSRNELEEWENSTVSWLCARSGQFLPRIRKCGPCGAWFFALVQHQMHCSDKCRKKYSSGSEAFKERRREYMRSYRQREKQINSKSIQLAKNG